MALNQFKYKAFISYSHADRRWAKKLQEYLEAYRIPKGVGSNQGAANRFPLRPVFRDEEELAAAPKLDERIEEALTQSEALVVVCSPQSIKSQWVNEEIRTFRRLGDGPIFALVVERSPSHQDELFPPALIEHGYEPLAADVTRDTGRREAFLKLTAGLLNLGFDELRQREARRRNRRQAAIVSGSTAGMLLAVVLATIAVVSRNEAQTERLRAEKEAGLANEVTEFLIDLFESTDPAETRGDEVTARDLLERGGVRVGSLDGQPLVQSRFRLTIGSAYRKLGFFDDAEPHVRLSLETRLEQLGENDPETLRAMHQLAMILHDQGKIYEAAHMYEEVLSKLREVLGRFHRDTLRAMNNLALVYHYELDNRQKDAEALYQEALAGQQEMLGKIDIETIRTQTNLATLYSMTGRVAEARILLVNAIAALRDSVGNDHPNTIGTIANLAIVLAQNGEPEEAEGYFLEVLELRRKVMGPNHTDTAAAANNLGYLYFETERYEEAEKYLQAAMDIRTVNIGRDHPATLSTAANLATVHGIMGRFIEAENEFREILEAQRKVLGEEHTATLTSELDLAQSLHAQGNHAEARRQILGTLKSDNTTSVLEDYIEFAEGFLLFLEQVQSESVLH